MREKKEGEAQSLQPPISYVNSNSKDKTNLSNSQTITEFSYWERGKQDIDYSITPTKTISLIDIYEHVKLDSGQDKDWNAYIKPHGTFKTPHEFNIIRTSGLMHFEIKCLPHDIEKLKVELSELKEIDVLMMFKNSTNDGVNVVVPSGVIMEVGDYQFAKYKNDYTNVFNMYAGYLIHNIGRNITRKDRCYLPHDASIYMSDKVKAGSWKYNQLAEYWKEEKEVTKSIVRTDADPLFYSIDYKGKPSLEPVELNNFMRDKGFIREIGTDKFIKISNKILEYYPKEEISNFLMQFVPQDNLRNEVLACIAHKWKIQIMDYMQLMDGQEVKYHRDTADAVYIPFKNGVLKITKDSIKMLDYSDEEIGFFPDGIESMSHNFIISSDDKASHKEGVFERFVRYGITGNDKPISDLTDKEKRDFEAVCSAVGYLISSNKKNSEAYCIIYSDEGSNDIANAGGRGKTLLLEMISKVLTRLYKGKNDWRKDDKFALAGLQKHNTLIVHDDVPAGYDWIANYTLITGDMEVQPKYVNPFTLTFKESPKIVVTTNNAVRYNEDADSTNRRYREYKFSKFWNINRTPSDYFGGGDFFDDWSEQDWREAFEFLIRCVQVFLNKGVIPIAYDKAFDNYVATFNDAREQEFERIFNELDSELEFNVTKFREIHSQKHFGNGAEYNLSIVKARDSINHYINYHKLDWEYLKSEKSWKRVNFSDYEIDDSLPF